MVDLFRPCSRCEDYSCEHNRTQRSYARRCPFCGSENIDYTCKYDDSDHEIVFCYCDDCGACAGGVQVTYVSSDSICDIGLARHRALGVWNDRWTDNTSPCEICINPDL